MQRSVVLFQPLQIELRQLGGRDLASAHQVSEIADGVESQFGTIRGNRHDFGWGPGDWLLSRYHYEAGWERIKDQRWRITIKKPDFSDRFK